MRWLLIGSVVLALTACTKHNKEFCCTSLEDCQTQGVDEEQRACDEGLACVDHACAVPMCATAGCGPEAPTCDIHTDVCSACTDSRECSRFGTTALCEPTSGTCVACLSADDCQATAPICDQHACRGCRLDTECASGACDDNGSCVPPDNAVYLSPDGTDVAPCSQTAPCKEPRFATEQTSALRQHIVFTHDVYNVSSLLWIINSAITSAPKVWVHGNGAKLITSASDGFLDAEIPTTIRDIEINNTVDGGRAVRASSDVQLEHVVLHGDVRSNGTVSLKDVTVFSTTSSGCAIALDAGSLTVDGARLDGGAHGVCASPSTVVSLTNLMVSTASDVGLDLADATGTVSFTTVARSGFLSSGATGLTCGLLSVRSSIIWAPEGGSRPAISGTCSVTSSIVGPTAYPGGMNVDPDFSDPDAYDFHLAPTSPAIDLVDTGPATDFEGDPRPKGDRFDIGADEVR